jgi:beta-1,4-N-acetylglucosaminyltransferase
MEEIIEENGSILHIHHVLSSHYGLVVLFFAVAIFVIRLSMCLPAFRRPRKTLRKSVSAMVVWGSGGHTTEMLRLIQHLDTSKYMPMTFVVAFSDKTSEDKIRTSTCPCAVNATWLRIPRSREVKQSWFTSVFTTAYATLHSFVMICRIQPEVILCNGPGTCVPLCMSAFVLRLLGVYQPVLIFAESFCRVKTLSFSGKILYYFVDRFIVQWSQLVDKYPRAEYFGKMI